LGGGLSAQGEVVLKATPALEAPRRRGAMVRVISTSEVLISSYVVQWTHVTSSFMGHKNIGKSQRNVMTP
jgi:hypothetical protein